MIYRLKLGLVFGFMLVTLAPAQAELTLRNDDPSFEGKVFVQQSMLDDHWVQVTIEVETAQPFDTFAGGFKTLGTATFNQAPADAAFALGGATDTAFTGDGDGVVLLDFESVDTDVALSTDAANWLSGQWGPLNERYGFAQLVLPVASKFDVFGRGDAEDSGGLGLISNGQIVGVIEGNFTTVPEPGSIMLALAGCVGGAGVFLVRRRRTAR